MQDTLVSIQKELSRHKMSDQKQHQAQWIMRQPRITFLIKKQVYFFEVNSFKKYFLIMEGSKSKLKFPIRHHLTPFNTIHMVSRHQTTPFNTSMFFQNLAKNDDFSKILPKIDDFSNF